MVFPPEVGFGVGFFLRETELAHLHAYETELAHLHAYEAELAHFYAKLLVAIVLTMVPSRNVLSVMDVSSMTA